MLLVAGNCCQFVARLLLDTKEYMLPRYRQHVAGNKQKQYVAGHWCKRGLTHRLWITQTNSGRKKSVIIELSGE